MSIQARYVWAYLPCHADREGRLRDSPFALKAAILPADDCDMGELIDELAARRHVVRYEVDGRRYLQIRNFSKYQWPHKNEASSVIPSPGETSETGLAKKVYFIQNESNGQIKIGTSVDVRCRISLLQTGSTDRLKLIGTMSGGLEQEKILHRRFSAHRRNGEWFEPVAEILSYVEEFAKSHVPEDSSASPVISKSTPPVPEIGSGTRRTDNGERITEIQTVASLGVPSYDPAFEAFWSAIEAIGRRKGDKAEAQKIWIRKGRPISTVLIAGWRSYRASCGDGFTMDADKWLRHDGWLKEYEPSAPKKITSAVDKKFNDHQQMFQEGREWAAEGDK